MGNDLSIYEDFAAEWWEPSSKKFRSLQGISKLRLELLKRWVPQLEGRVLLDLGCGGGLLSVPLDKSGARVIGLDLSVASLQQARLRTSAGASFLKADVRALPLESNVADVVVIADVLDHIAEYPLVLREIARVLKPGGLVFVNTINRSLLSKFLAITVAENIGLIPKGTHDAKFFIKPAELKSAAEKAGLSWRAFQGERPAIGQTLKHWAIHFAETSALSVAYSALFAKPADCSDMPY